MPIKYTNEGDKSSGRKDTGRTDKYSDENPKKDYQDFRADNPGERKERKEAEEITLKIRSPQPLGKKSVELKKQELVSHIQNYQETFNNQMNKAWKTKLRELLEALG